MIILGQVLRNGILGNWESAESQCTRTGLIRTWEEQNPIFSVNVLRMILNGSEATLPKTGFRPGGVASPGTVSPHRTQLGVDFVADQLADGSRFRSLTVVDIVGLTFF
jgi:hypothetical protein